MASNFDKSLSEIIRAKGIQKPDFKKRKNKPHFIPSASSVGRRISWNKTYQKRISEDQSKSTRVRKKIEWKKTSENGQRETSGDESKSFIVLTGLANSITRQDLEELFGPFVGRKTNLDIKMHYNCAGAVIGSAEVGMPTEKAAQQAAETYNGIDLDGSTMSVLVAGQPAIWTGTGNSPHKPGPSRNFAPKRKMTAKDLDAELDEYRKSREGKNTEKMDTSDNNNNFENEKTTVKDLDVEMFEYHTNKGVQNSLFPAPASRRVSVFARASISKKSKKISFP